MSKQELMNLSKEELADKVIALVAKVEALKTDYEDMLQEGYEEAYLMLQEEKALRETIELDLYNEYDKKVQDQRNFFVEQIDKFMDEKFDEMMATDKKDMAVKIAAWRMAISPAEMMEMAVGGGKMSYKEMSARNKVLEARNVRLEVLNAQLAQSVAATTAMIQQEPLLKKAIYDRISPLDITHLQMSSHTISALKARNINTIRQMVECEDLNFLDDKSLNEVTNRLASVKSVMHDVEQPLPII